jgi:hypothetical protein
MHINRLPPPPPSETWRRLKIKLSLVELNGEVVFSDVTGKERGQDDMQSIYKQEAL